MGACVCVCVSVSVSVSERKTGISGIYKLWVPHLKDRGQHSRLFSRNFCLRNSSSLLRVECNAGQHNKEREGRLTACCVETAKKQYRVGVKCQTVFSTMTKLCSDREYIIGTRVFFNDGFADFFLRSVAKQQQPSAYQM